MTSNHPPISNFIHLVVTIVAYCQFGEPAETERAGIPNAAASWLTLEQLNLDVELDQELTFTCKGLCGVAHNLPCSCAASCLVYDTCCENITQDCPLTIREGREKYAPFIGSRVSCGASNVFRILSCPDDGNGNTTNTSYVDFELDIKDSTKRTSIQLSLEKIGQALLYAPVTASDSGFTFLNSFIYDCYKSFGLTSKPQKWHLNFKYTESETSQFGILNTVYTSVPYEAKFKHRDVMEPHQCDRDVINSCDKSTYDGYLADPVRDYLARKCKEFTTHIRSRSSIFYKTYRNRFCAYCHEGQHDKLSRQVLGYVPGVHISYSVLASLNQNGTVKLTSSLSRFGTWSTAECPSLNAMSSDNLKLRDSIGEEKQYSPLEGCQVIDCYEGYDLSTNGLCMKSRHTKIAFSSDHDLDNHLCWPPLQQVAEYISCNLDLLLDRGPIKYDVLGKPDFSFLHDSESGKKLFAVHISLITSGRDGYYFFGHTQQETAYNLHKLAVVVKTFRAYMQVSRPCSSEHDQTHHNDTHGSAATHTTTSLSFLPSHLMEEMVKLRGPVVNHNVTTTVCASKIYLSDYTGNYLVECFEDVDYQQDARVIAHLLSSPCVSLLHAKNNSLSVKNFSDAQRYILLIYFCLISLAHTWPKKRLSIKASSASTTKLCRQKRRWK